MPTPGTLTRDNVGFSMPADAALYPAPPYDYAGASLIVFEYLTDAATASRLLPAQAALTEPPVAGLVFADYPRSSLGPYREVVLYLHALYQGRTVQFASHLYVTTDVAMAAGREMGGFPKKLGAIAFDDSATLTASLERPAGTSLASGTLTPVGEPQSVPTSTLDYLTLRIIPSPVKGAPPTVSELLETDWIMSDSQVWAGEGTCTVTGASPDDPLHLAPVLQLLGCKLVRGSLRVSANDRPRTAPF